MRRESVDMVETNKQSVRKRMRTGRPMTERRRSTGERIFFILVFIYFALYSLTIIYMLSWSFLSSLKENREFFNYPFSLPKKWLFSNYAEAFKAVNINDTSLVGMVFNSVWYSFGSVFLSNMTAALVGYTFSKYDFRGKNFMYSVNLFTMIVPIFSAGAASYRLIYSLRLNDSPLLLITSISGMGMSFIIYYSVFNGISNSYIEAACMDGAGPFSVFFKVAIPQLMPTFLALSITGFIAAWNNWSTPLYYLEKMPTLASGIYFFQQELVYASNEPLYFAACMMSSVPVIALFALSQSKIMNNVSAGGLKG